jgi:hypothetical protein
VHTSEYYHENRAVVEVSAQGKQGSQHDEQTSGIISYSCFYIPGKSEIINTLW